MRVLHVMADIAPSHGGPSTAVWALSRAALAAGHEVRLVTTNDAVPGARQEHVPVGTSDEMDIRIHSQFPHNRYRFSLPMWRGLTNDVQWAEIVHVHSLFLAHTVRAARLARRYGRPYIVRPHGSLGPETVAGFHGAQWLHYRLFDRPLLRAAAAIHVTSEKESREVIQLGYDPTRVKTVKLPLHMPNAALQADVSRDLLQVIFLGRLTAKKHPELLIDALALRGLESVRAIFVGPNDDWAASTLAARAARLGVQDRVTFLGPEYEPAAKRRLLASSLCMVLPSDHENFGIAVVESLQAGTPVILGRGVALAPTVQEAGAGLVLESNQADVLATALVAMLKPDARLAERHCAVAADRILAGASEELLQLYEDVLNG